MMDIPFFTRGSRDPTAAATAEVGERNAQVEGSGGNAGIHLVGCLEHFFFHNIWDNPSH
jgi:hypothetical protein